MSLSILPNNNDTNLLFERTMLPCEVQTGHNPIRVVRPHPRKEVHWGWATFHSIQDVPCCSEISDEERLRIWWQHRDLEQFKSNQRNDFEQDPKALDEKRKGSFARLFAMRTIMKIQKQALEISDAPLRPEIAALSLEKINGYTRRCALRRAVSLVDELSGFSDIDNPSHDISSNTNDNGIIRCSSMLSMPVSLASSPVSPRATALVSNKRDHSRITDFDDVSVIYYTKKPSFLNQRWKFGTESVSSFTDDLSKPCKKARIRMGRSNSMP